MSFRVFSGTGVYCRSGLFAGVLLWDVMVMNWQEFVSD